MKTTIELQKDGYWTVTVFYIDRESYLSSKMVNFSSYDHAAKFAQTIINAVVHN